MRDRGFSLSHAIVREVLAQGAASAEEVLARAERGKGLLNRAKHVLSALVESDQAYVIPAPKGQPIRYALTGRGPRGDV